MFLKSQIMPPSPHTFKHSIETTRRDKEGCFTHLGMTGMEFANRSCLSEFTLDTKGKRDGQKKNTNPPLPLPKASHLALNSHIFCPALKPEVSLYDPWPKPFQCYWQHRAKVREKQMQCLNKIIRACSSQSLAQFTFLTQLPLLGWESI